MNENEQKIVTKYEKLGHDVIKDGMPDIVLLKDGKIEFVEVKYRKDNTSPNQQRALRLLRKHGFQARVERIAHIQNSRLLEKWKKEKEVKT